MSQLTKTQIQEFKNCLASEAQANDQLAWFNFLVSFVPFVTLILICMYFISEPLLTGFLLIIPLHIFHARLFVIMHDCGHNSFFKKRWANDLVGHICSFFYLIPFYVWRELHNKHHRNQGILQRRYESFDVWTLTVVEYQKMNLIMRLAYRVYRHPIFLFWIAPIIFFVLIFRIPFEKFSKKAVLNIFTLNIVLWLLYSLHLIELEKFFLVLLPTLFLSYSMASFLFYAQHQYQNTIWLNDSEKDMDLISLQGSSYITLPKWLGWCYGQINHHHIHHLNPMVPLYNLPRAQSKMDFSTKSKISLWELIGVYKVKLWDEDLKQMKDF